MTERERLIEILNKAPKSLRYEDLPDYLLENNVKPLPFKIDDIVYGISRGEVIPIKIDSIQYTSKGVEIRGTNEEYFSYCRVYIDINNQIGIQWYKTKEEAKKALEEMRK